LQFVLESFVPPGITDQKNSPVIEYRIMKVNKVFHYFDILRFKTKWRLLSVFEFDIWIANIVDLTFKLLGSNRDYEINGYPKDIF